MSTPLSPSGIRGSKHSLMYIVSYGICVHERCEETVGSWFRKSQIGELLAESDGAGPWGCYYVFATKKQLSSMLRVKAAIPASNFRHGLDFVRDAWGDGRGSGGFGEALGCNWGSIIPLI